jgi:hypothetical protein
MRTAPERLRQNGEF